MKNIGIRIVTCWAMAASVSAFADQTTDERVDVLTREVEALKQRLDSESVSTHTSIGGYGELHYQNLDGGNQIDFHRFVLFIGHEFNDRIRLASEVEVEHVLAGDGENGEVEIEQAYVEFDLSDRHVARGGLFLVPVGILNETHEPPTFYGVERNPVEVNIVPSTWWEAGAALQGELAPGFKYDLAFTSGLSVPTVGADAFLIRDGRQEVSKATANDPAYTARLKWTAVQGLELSATVQYQKDVTQRALPESSRGLLVEAHAIVSHGPFAVRTLYAQWALGGAAPQALGRDKQKGWYIEPSYKLLPSLGVFVRYNEWDNEAGDAIDSKKKQTNFGVNYWPHEKVAIKFDVQKQGGAIGDDGFNIGIGYMF